MSLYVSKNGVDSNQANGTYEKPYNTLTYALSQRTNEQNSVSKGSYEINDSYY